MKLVISNNTEKIKISSDQLFRSQIEKKFYLNKHNFNDLYFMYYGTPIYYKDYLKEFGNIDNFIEEINKCRNKFGVPLEIEGNTFHIIASDEELEIIFKNYVKESNLIFPDIGEIDD